MLARPRFSEPLNRMKPRYKFGVWLGGRNNSAECFVCTARGVVQGARGQEDRRARQVGDREAINNVIGGLWRLVDGKMDMWTGH